MTTLIHVLGSDIPHHNQTVLRFFNDVLAPQLPREEMPEFMVVSTAGQLLAQYPNLELDVWPDKKAWRMPSQRKQNVTGSVAFSSMVSLMP